MQRAPAGRPVRADTNAGPTPSERQAGRGAAARRLSEREDVRTHARLRERDLEDALRGAAGLTDELVHPRLLAGAFAGRIDVDAVVVTRLPTVEAHGELNRGAGRGRRDDQVEV